MLASKKSIRTAVIMSAGFALAVPVVFAQNYNPDPYGIQQRQLQEAIDRNTQAIQNQQLYQQPRYQQQPLINYSPMAEGWRRGIEQQQMLNRLDQQNHQLYQQRYDSMNREQVENYLSSLPANRARAAQAGESDAYFFVNQYKHIVADQTFQRFSSVIQGMILTQYRQYVEQAGYDLTVLLNRSANGTQQEVREGKRTQESLEKIPEVPFAQASANNSNIWSVHRDSQTGFRISYPPAWIIVPPKGRNVRFSVNPPSGPGNCNVAARTNAEFSGMTQPVLNREIEALPINQASWAEYIGLPPSQVRVIETHRARIQDIPAVIGVLETTLENLEGKFTRKQIVAFIFTPDLMWSLNCGVSTFKVDHARSRFVELQPTFNKVFGSFAFLK
ncbi:hypothetical protein AGMMS50225_04390 [Betaproteobacteria bacterium]|nr:hypothetical protein AGMMS50225_04390 [Betaproteobacteria bacterium]